MEKERLKVIIAGTFDIIHKGHRALFKRAFSLGEAAVGLTSDAMVKRTKRRKIQSFNERKKQLGKFIFREFAKKPAIRKIEDEIGFALEKYFDCIVVSPQTEKTALLINKKRREKGLPSLQISRIEFVLGKNGKPVSSTALYEEHLSP